MKKIFFILLWGISASVIAQTTETKIEGDFNEIKIFSKIETTLIKSTENKIVASGFDKDEIQAEVKNNVLSVRLSLSNIWSKNDTRVKIYYKSAGIIDVNEGSFAEIKDRIQQNKLEVRAQEGARIYAGQLEVEELEVRIVTGGEIELAGNAANQKVSIKAGGEYEAEGLLTKKTDVKVSAGGTASIYALDYCRANIKAGGSIYIYGNPSEIDKKTTLGGKIKKR